MKTVKPNKLSLSKETLRSLNDAELNTVAGATGIGCKSYSCLPCGSAACLPPKKIIIIK